jgi:hypothetical protein
MASRSKRFYFAYINNHTDNHFGVRVENDR